VLVRDDSPGGDWRPDAPGTGPLAGKVVPIDGLWEPTADVSPSSGASWDQPLAIFFTSGTTGRSKGALTTHQYLLSAAAAMVDCWRLQPAETVYAPLPLFHLSAVGSVLGPLIAGSTAVIDRAFSVSSTWGRVREHDACGILLAGAMVVMLWNLPPDEDDRHLPIRFLSAAPVPAELYRGIEERYACKVVTVYGLSEAFPITCAGVGDDNPPGASGRPNPRLEVAVVDDHDDAVPRGTVGQIVCRPREPHVMFEGYDGRPTETLQQLRNLWFHTGDLGRFDEAGNLTYVDRKKDAIRRRGENISSFEVEQTILHHPAVAESAAIGVPSDVGEDDVMVCLILKPGAQLEMAELIDFCAARMPYFAVPRYVEIMDQLPKNVIGRILKPELRQRGVTPSTWDREEAGYVLRR
jgi:crotonobetaine/carnitine-CoA ligase